MEMGDIIKQLRLQRGITQEELGNVIGVQKSAIRKYESGKVENMKRSSIKKMADFFNVSPSYLMGMEENINYGVNNGILGNQNTNNIIRVVQNEELPPMEKIIVSIFKNLTEEQKSEVIVYASNIMNTKNGGKKWKSF